MPGNSDICVYGIHCMLAIRLSQINCNNSLTVAYSKIIERGSMKKDDRTYYTRIYYHGCDINSISRSQLWNRMK